MVTAVQNNSVGGLGAQATTSAQSLADNYSTFITLLTAQLQNQDPLKPTDSNQFIQQLVSFSGVEQQIRASDQLEKLVSLQQGSATTMAVGYLGKTVTLDSATTALKDGAATWNYSLPSAASLTTIMVKDSAGKTVFTKTGENGAGPHTFTWDGKNATGDVQKDGNYTISIKSNDGNGGTVTPNISVKAKITAVDLSSGAPMVETNVGAYALERILRVDA
jgi:flagellar basal-body rod modification protein FlgD